MPKHRDRAGPQPAAGHGLADAVMAASREQFEDVPVGHMRPAIEGKRGFAFARCRRKPGRGGGTPPFVERFLQ